MRLAAGIAALISLLAGLLPLAVSATPRHPVGGELPFATHEPVGETTLTPYGWVEFCSRYASECLPSAGAREITLDTQTWRTITQVNASVNARVKPLSDQRHWGVIDQWDIPTDGFGDCEDYVLLKRKLLTERGLPSAALLVTVVKDIEGDGHALLTVRTDRGDFVLDNMTSRVRAWEDAPYRFVKQQSQSDPNLWVQIGPATASPLIVSRRDRATYTRRSGTLR